MSIAEILAQIDSEIAQLDQVRRLLADGRNVQPGPNVAKTKAGRTKRTLGAEARKKIAEAQRKRWAARKAKK